MIVEHAGKEHGMKGYGMKRYGMKGHGVKEIGMEEHSMEQHDKREHDRKEYGMKEYSMKEHDMEEPDMEKYDKKEHAVNEVIRSLHERKSVRVFTDQEITAEQKEAILYAAMAAPTAGNQQLYTILDIQDEALKKRLVVTCDDQPFIARAKLVLLFCADLQKWVDAFVEGGCEPREPGVGDLLLAVSDANIAAQNAVTAAQSLGIGSCYIGDIMENCEIHRELLGLPAYVFPAAMLVFGYPTRQQQERPKPERCRLEDIVQVDRYRRRDGAKLRRMFEKECRHQSFEEWIQRFCARKYDSDFSREMTRSVGVYLEAFQKAGG